MAYQGFTQNDDVETIAKGTKFIGGTISTNFTGAKTNFPNADDSKSKTTSFGIGPEAGKYIRDNLAFGLGLSYNMSTSKNEYADGSDSKSTYNSAGIYGLIRKNYKIVPNVFFFLEGRLGFSYGTTKSTNSSGNESKMSSYYAALGASPGFQLFLAKKFSFETSLGSIGYQFTRSDYDNSDVYTTNHHVGFDGGFGGINFSVTYFIFQ